MTYETWGLSWKGTLSLQHMTYNCNTRRTTATIATHDTRHMPYYEPFCWKSLAKEAHKVRDTRDDTRHTPATICNTWHTTRDRHVTHDTWHIRNDFAGHIPPEAPTQRHSYCNTCHTTATVTCTATHDIPLQQLQHMTHDTCHITNHFAGNLLQKRPTKFVAHMMTHDTRHKIYNSVGNVLRKKPTQIGLVFKRGLHKQDFFSKEI